MSEESITPVGKGIPGGDSILLGLGSEPPEKFRVWVGLCCFGGCVGGTGRLSGLLVRVVIVSRVVTRVLSVRRSSASRCVRCEVEIDFFSVLSEVGACGDCGYRGSGRSVRLPPCCARGLEVPLSFADLRSEWDGSLALDDEDITATCGVCDL